MVTLDTKSAYRIIGLTQKSIKKTAIQLKGIARERFQAQTVIYLGYGGFKSGLLLSTFFRFCEKSGTNAATTFSNCIFVSYFIFHDARCTFSPIF